MKSLFSVKGLTRGAAVAALYVLLTLLTSVFGLSSGVIQIRLSEALCVLPIFMPEAIPGLFIGCILANALSGCLFWDVVFGSIATLIGAIGAYLLRRLPKRLLFFATLPTIIANALIIPPVLTLVYGSDTALYLLFLSVLTSEIICAGGFGSALALYMSKSRIFK